jgi:uncharacterized Tic20 family protein
MGCMRKTWVQMALGGVALGVAEAVGVVFILVGAGLPLARMLEWVALMLAGMGVALMLVRAVLAVVELVAAEMVKAELEEGETRRFRLLLRLLKRKKAPSFDYSNLKHWASDI